MNDVTALVEENEQLKAKVKLLEDLFLSYLPTERQVSAQACTDRWIVVQDWNGHHKLIDRRTRETLRMRDKDEMLRTIYADLTPVNS